MKLTLETKIKEIVNKYDPIGLIKIGSPVDEYEPEIKMIIPLLEKCANKKEFYDKVYDVFVEMFDKKIAGFKKEYKKLSEEIYLLK